MDLPNLAPTSRTNPTSHNADNNLQDSKCLYKQPPHTIPRRPALRTRLSLLDHPQHQDFHATHRREGKWVRICAVSILFYFPAIAFTSVRDFYTVNPFRLLSIDETCEFLGLVIDCHHGCQCHQDHLTNTHHTSIDVCVAFVRLYGGQEGPQNPRVCTCGYGSG